MKISRLWRTKQVQKKNNVYTTCNTLCIHNFNEVANNSDFSYLKKDRNEDVNDEVLQLAWLDILDEYLTISNNQIALTLLNKKAKVMLLEKKLNVLLVMKYCIDRNIDISEQLKEYNLKAEKVQINIGLIKNDISRISNSIPSDSERKSNNTDFDKSIAMLNKNGFNINRFTTVVSEWVQALNILEQQYKANKNG